MKGKVAVCALALALAVPVTASAHSTVTPKAVAWQVKELANKNLKFVGNPTRVRSVKCLAHGGGLFVCRAKLSDGTQFYWPTVSIKNGYLKVSGGTAI